MGKLLILDETIEVNRPIAEVFAYLSDFSRIEEWDPAVERGTKLTPGAPAVGSEYQIDMKAGFALKYRVLELEPGRRMLMDVESRFFTAREEISCSETTPGQSKVRYLAKFSLPTTLAIATSLYPAAMDRIAKNTMKGLKEALEDNFESPTPSGCVALSDRLILPGIWRFTRFGYSVSRGNWKPMSAYLGNRHALVTGGTSGIGLATVKALAAMGARVTVVARDKDKANAIVEEVQLNTGNPQVSFEICDMTLMEDVNALADRLLASGEPIDILVNNAGALYSSREETKENLEKSFALLLLAPYILTERLQPLLAKSGSGRVVNVSSGGMYTQKICLDDLQSERGRFSGSVAYARAKRGLMVLTEVWAEKWQDDGIVVNAMHPGWADTAGVETSLPGFYRATRKLLRSPGEGADTIVWLAASSEAGKVSGKFWLDREQHPSHLFKRTREAASERAQLLSELHSLMNRIGG